MNLQFILSILLCCCCLSISAQDVELISKNIEPYDVIHLKDGSVLKGQVHYETYAEDVDIKLTSGAIIAIPTNSIETIKARKKNFTYFSNGKGRRDKGYFGLIKLGLMISKDFEFNLDPQIHTVHGIRINKELAAGIGIGIDGYYDLTFIPVYAHVRYTPFDKKIRPYISGDIGYGIPKDDTIWDNYNRGLMIQPAIGLQFSARSGGGFFFELGQKFQWTSRDWESWNGSSRDEIRLSRVTFSLGYQF